MRKLFLQLVITCTMADALQTLRPGAEWALTGSTYSGLTWIDAAQVKPTSAEVVSAIQDCRTAAAARVAAKTQARIDVKDTNLTQAQRMQALLILLDYDQ